MAKTYYETLEVSPDASPEEIRAAYRAKVKETHPDVSDDPDAGKRFQRVQRAKEVLTDETQRERYDRLGHEGYVDGVVNPATDADGADANSDTADADFTSGGSTGADTATGTTGTGSATASAETASGSASATAADWHVSDDDTKSWADDGATQQQRRRTERSGSAYATRTTTSHTSYDGVRVPLTPRTAITMVTTFVLYPVFVFSSVLPQFPLTVNLVLGLCTVFVIAYLVSMPEVAIVVFGAWSVLAPLILLSVEGLALFSLVGIVALVATWFPFGLALLARSALRA